MVHLCLVILCLYDFTMFTDFLCFGGRGLSGFDIFGVVLRDFSCCVCLFIVCLC